MNITLSQINPILGDFQYNFDKILSFYQEAVSNKSDLVVFPELSITGYPPQDLLLENSFIQENLHTADALSRKIGEIPAIFGFIRQHDSRLFNSAAIVKNGKYLGTYDKVLLPTYDVFDEIRYFSAGENCFPIRIILADKETSIGLQICEDLWDEEYERKVTDEMVKGGAELIINISASPFSEGKGFERKNLIKAKVDRFAVPFLYCNLVGAQDELIFDGHSLAYASNGKLIAEGKQFEEDMITFNLNNLDLEEVEQGLYCREQELFKGLTLGIRDYFRKTGHSRCVIGLSGGIDSALTACLAVEALGKENVFCISMPSYFSSKHSVDDAVKLSKNLGVELKIIRIDELMAEYNNSVREAFEGMQKDVTEENIQARIRGNLLMAFSNKLGYLVLSTGNKTELALGYCTLYGDMSGGLAVISDLGKTDVYDMAEWYNESKGKKIIPENIFKKMPSAELSENQVDPFDYEVVSPLVDEFVEYHRSKKELVEMGYDSKLVNRIYELIHKAEFKRRQAAPSLRVTSKAFGMGRRYPIVNHFNGG